MDILGVSKKGFNNRYSPSSTVAMGSPTPAAMMKYTRVLTMRAGSTRLSRLRAARLHITITDLVSRTLTPATRLQGTTGIGYFLTR